VKTDKFEVYGYCLMSNHVHLLIYEKKVIEGATQRQIARVTGLNENMIFKASIGKQKERPHASLLDGRKAGSFSQGLLDDGLCLLF
jgi:REP element-mobilizing transposase RayT